MMQKGDVVKYHGKIYEVFKVVGEHVGLLDPDREPIIDKNNGQVVAHLAVKKADLDQ